MTETLTQSLEKETSSESSPEPEVRTKVGVMIATPMRRFLGWDPVHEEFLKKLAQLSLDEYCPYEFMQAVVEGGRTWGRCRVVSNFRKMRRQFPNLKWLYWHDHDMGADAEELVNGLLRLLSHKLPVVGAMYTTKGEHPHWCTNFLHEVELQHNGLLQVFETGCGGLLTHYTLYDVIEASHQVLQYTDRDTGEKHSGFFQEIVIEKVPYPEDYFFSWLCRNTRVLDPTPEDPKHLKMGVGVFVDTTVRLHHRDADGKAYPIEAWPPIPIDEKAPE